MAAAGAVAVAVAGTWKYANDKDKVDSIVFKAHAWLVAAAGAVEGAVAGPCKHRKQVSRIINCNIKFKYVQFEICRLNGAVRG